MIVLCTDFGLSGPYIGQMIARLRMCGYSGDVINLFSDLPAFSVKACARLLPAYVTDFPDNSVFLCVVDPGVGSDRRPIVFKRSGQWFVGPDNGIFEFLIRSDAECEAWEIVWKPEQLSSSFHGRDLFAPIAACIMSGGLDEKVTPVDLEALTRMDWPDAVQEIIYIDHFGNAMTGIGSADGIEAVRVGDDTLELSNTFSSVPVGMPLAYENANGLIEIAVNQGRADDYFNLSIGSSISIVKASC